MAHCVVTRTLLVLECATLQESGESDFGTFPAAWNDQPAVSVPAAGRQSVSDGLQGRQCRHAVFAGRMINIQFSNTVTQ